MAGSQLTVSQAAAAVGLTVRALHHYDATGLVVPSARTGAGHRRYDASDLARLERVAALRRAGLALAEIAEALASGDVRAALERRLAAVDQEVAAATELRARLERAIGELRMIEDKLAARRAAVGDERIREVEREWGELFASLDDLRAAGAEAADPRVQELVRRGAALFAEFHGGDRELREHAGRAWQEQGPEAASRGMVSAELWAFYLAAQRV
jgi:MerR family transcriptional regulator, thiopeptide resistance regulator